MNPLPKSVLRSGRELGASVPAVLLIAVLSAAIGATLVFVIKKPKAQAPAIVETGSLSEGTRTALQNLESPVEVRCYTMLDPKTVSPEMKDFAARVEKLIAAYEVESAGKVQVQRFSSTSDPDAVHSASRDGVQPFNLQSGDACFLGVAVAQDDRLETLPRLSAEWESALEADLTRAITRVAAKPAAPAVAGSGIDPAVRAAALEQVQLAIPQPANLSLDDGKKRLREAAFEEFKAATIETQTRVTEAQQKLAAIQGNGSDADRQAALRELQEAQRIQATKLKEIAARSQAQVEAWEQLKSKAP
jgi:hypothetical protein